MRVSADTSVPRIGLRSSPQQQARLARFVQLAERHGRDVRSVCRQFGISLGDVDDVVQRVFITVYAKVDRIEPGSERAFVVAVARRVVGHVRRTYARRAEVGDSLLAPRSSGAVRLDERLHNKRLLADAHRVLDQMPQNLSSAWRMYELDGLSCSQIANTLEVPVGTVKTRLRRARAWLSR